MALNDRITIACGRCDGSGFDPASRLKTCPECDGCGEDHAAEARLAELAEDIVPSAQFIRTFADTIGQKSPQRFDPEGGHATAARLDALAAILLQPEPGSS